MSSEYYDDLYILVVKPTVNITVVSKSASPTITIVADPCLEPLAILTESSVEILHEDSRTMVKEG